MLAQPRSRRGGLGAGTPAVDADGGLRGVRGCGAADGGDVVEQRTVGVVADRGDHRHPEQRDRAAEGLVAEAEQVGQGAAAAGDDRDLDLAHRGEVSQGVDDRGRRVAILHGGKAPDEPSGPAATGKRGEDVVARLAALARDHADRAGKQRQVQALLALEQPLGVERLAQAVDPREQVSLPGHAQVGYGEREAGRGGGAAGVEVAAARDHHLHALGGRLIARAREDRVPVLLPDRAWNRAGGVAQLEVDPGAGGAQVYELADELHVGERAQLPAQRGGVLPDRERPGEAAAGNARVGGCGWRREWRGRGHRSPA